MALDLNAMWDFNQPAVSEARFRQALTQATGDDALILQTQIARTYGLRKEFGQAQALLDSIRPLVRQAGPEAQVRFELECGRTLASAKHSEAQAQAAAKAGAKAAYLRAVALAKQAKLDGLAVDALHMMAFVDTAPAEQLRWGQEALALAMASEQSAARRWEGSLRNNIGYALHQLGRHDEALAEFERAVVLRQTQGNAESLRSAQWMVAWTLRALKRDDQALAMQLRLEQECEAANAPDEYVFEELEILYRGKGDEAKAQAYGRKLQALRKP